MLKSVSYEKGTFASLSFSDTFGVKSSVKVFLHGREVEVSSRFWGSFARTLNIGMPQDFKLFSASECLERLKNQKTETLVFCVEEGEKPVLHAMNYDNRKEVFRQEDILSYLDGRYGIKDNVSYHEGVISFYADTGKGIKLYNSDDLVARKVLEFPVDNFGSPQIFTEFLRLVCENGMRAQHKEFVKKINLGDDISRLNDVFDMYDNSKSFDKMHNLFDDKSKIQASASEFLEVLKTAEDVYTPSVMGIIYPRVFKMSGLADQWNISSKESLELLNNKQRNSIPTQFSAMDTINLLTELRTHVGVGSKTRKIDKKVGDLLVKKDWHFKDIELPVGLGLDFEKTSVGNYFTREERTNLKSLLVDKKKVEIVS